MINVIKLRHPTVYQQRNITVPFTCPIYLNNQYRQPIQISFTGMPLNYGENAIHLRYYS